jgi:hypothetical protein
MGKLIIEMLYPEMLRFKVKIIRSSFLLVVDVDVLKDNMNKRKLFCSFLAICILSKQSLK